MPSARTVGTTSTEKKPASSAGAEGDTSDQGMNQENRQMEAITVSPEVMDPVESFDGCAKDEDREPAADTAVTTPPMIESSSKERVRLADDDTTTPEPVVQQLETSRKEVQVRLAENDLLTAEPVPQQLESEGSEKENIEVDKTKKPLGRCAPFRTIIKLLVTAAVASAIVIIVYYYRNHSADTFAEYFQLDQLKSKCKQSTVPASSWWSLKAVESKTEKVMLAQVQAGQTALQ